MNILGTTTEMDDSGGYAADRVSRVEFLRLSRWFALILCLIAAILPPLFGQPGVWSALGLAQLFSWKTALGGIMGLFVGTVVSVLALYWRPLHDIIQHMTVLVAWETFRPWDYFAVAVLAGLGEELLFRGALQPLIGLVPIAVIFGLLHATALAHVILATLLGLWLGWLYLWTESLWPPIAAHAALDLVTGLLLACAGQTDALLSRGD
jgi:membrane protease YdiL (CAAX protease family)